jgi:hypothetical protein
MGMSGDPLPPVLFSSSTQKAVTKEDENPTFVTAFS